MKRAEASLRPAPVNLDRAVRDLPGETREDALVEPVHRGLVRRNFPAVAGVAVGIVAHECPRVDQVKLRGPHDSEDLRREITLPDAELGADGSAGRQLQDEPAAVAPEAWQHDARRYH